MLPTSLKGMTHFEMFTAARLADRYEERGVPEDEALDVAAHDLLEIKRYAPRLWSALRESGLGTRGVGDKLYEFIDGKIKSGMSIRNFADEFLARHNPAVEPSRGYSEGTSLAQVPGLHKLVMNHGGWKRGDVNADIGGGKYDLATSFLASHGVKNYVYDPGNRTRAHNEVVLRKIEDGRADTATIANVLNVIPDAKVRQQVLRLAKNVVRPGGAVYIAIYEGNGTGRGAETSKGWQENRKTKSYLPEVQRVLPGAFVKRGIIVAER